jgi:hypothetical protein
MYATTNISSTQSYSSSKFNLPEKIFNVNYQYPSFQHFHHFQIQTIIDAVYRTFFMIHYIIKWNIQVKLNKKHHFLSIIMIHVMIQ